MTFLVKLFSLVKKHSTLIFGLGIFTLGLLTFFRVFNDLSKNAGIAMSIIGIITIVYSFYKRVSKT
jgi:hypothetical protein